MSVYEQILVVDRTLALGKYEKRPVWYMKLDELKKQDKDGLNICPMLGEACADALRKVYPSVLRFLRASMVSPTLCKIWAPYLMRSHETIRITGKWSHEGRPKETPSKIFPHRGFPEFVVDLMNVIDDGAMIVLPC